MSLLLSGQVEALQPVSCGIARITNGSFNINNCSYSVKVVVFFFLQRFFGDKLAATGGRIRSVIRLH